MRSETDRARKKARAQSQHTLLRIEQITIKNYKGILELPLQFPTRPSIHEPDIAAFGSENGVGKTSILESIAFAHSALMNGSGKVQVLRALREQGEIAIDFGDLLIHSGHEECEIHAEFSYEGEILRSRLLLNREAQLSIEASRLPPALSRLQRESKLEGSEFYSIAAQIAGLDVDPVILPGLLYFHSFRRVREGNPELGMMVDQPDVRYRLRRGRSPVSSSFKIALLKSMMSQHRLFGDDEVDDSEMSIAYLNELLSRFSGGTIQNLKPSRDNTIDFRIGRLDEEGTFSFDGLSSGQKEIISTLFNIWSATKNSPAIVLIDEPETHLNAEWHRIFVTSLAKTNPQNQFILATHSERIMDEVPFGQRQFLRANPVNG